MSEYKIRLKISSINMPISSQKIFLIFFMIFILVLIFTSQNCRNEPDLIRFVEELSEKNVLTSPFKGLAQRFPVVEQHWKGEDMFLIDSRERKKWVIATEGRILGWSDNYKPEKMVVLRDGHELPYVKEKSKEKVSWSWQKVEEYIEPERYKGYKRFKGAILLPREKEFLSRPVILPKGTVILDIVASSFDPTSIIFMEISLNNQAPKIIPVHTYKNRKIFFKVRKTGLYQIKISFNDLLPSSSSKSENELLLDQVRITSSSELIIIETSKEKSLSLRKSSFSATYSIQGHTKYFYPKESQSAKEKPEFIELKKNQELNLSDIIIKPGKNIIEIFGFSNKSPGVLELWSSKSLVGRHQIKPHEWSTLSFPFFVKVPTNSLKLKWIPFESSSSSPGDYFIFFGAISHPPVETTLSTLYNIQHNYFIFDNGIKKNILFLKKKLELGEKTINALLAPPKSVYRFKIKIPKKARLSVGYGVIPHQWNSITEEVLFKIIIEENQKRSTLFSDTVYSKETENESGIHEKDFDLSAYSGKTIYLYFITECSGKNNNILLSFWSNPEIYRETSTFSRDKKPNIILISIDTLRADHLGCYGYDRETSPNLDRFAQDCVLFKRAHSQAPSTLPSHMSMLTSLYPVNHGLCTLSIGGPIGGGQKLDPTILTLADFLRKQGYVTFGITGGGQISSYFGFAKGFDYYEENKRSILLDTPERLLRKSSEFLKKYSQRPFFLFLHTYQTHMPYAPPPPYQTLFTDEKPIWKELDIIQLLSQREGKYSQLTDKERKNIISLYDGEIRYTDEKFLAPFLALLKKLNLYDNSMIIFTSDHGEEFYDHGGWEHGHSLYEELIHVPLLIKFPHSNPQGIIETPVRIVDLVPTILDIVDIKYKKKRLDGLSLNKVLVNQKDKPLPSLSFYFEAPLLGSAELKMSYVLLKTSLVFGKYKLIINEKLSLSDKEKQSFFWRVFNPPHPVERYELYDLESDPHETVNLAEKKHQVLKQMLELISVYYEKGKELEKKAVFQKRKENKALMEKLRALGYLK